MLDAGPLGMIAHPRADRNRDAKDWVVAMLRAGHRVYIPEIADYEIRRELIRAKLVASISRLDDLRQQLYYLPLTTKIIDRAAAFWAQSRNAGLQTADDKELDADAILAAQAVEVDAIVATGNVGHLQRFVNAEKWENIQPGM